MLSSEATGRRVRVAGFWHRALAGILDTLVLLPFMLLFAAITAAVGGRPLHGLGELGPDYVIELGLDGGPAGIAALGMAGLVALLYFGIFHALRGQTPAERLLGLRVIDAYGEAPTVARAAVRCLASLLALAGAGLGLLWIAFDREKRGLHDWIAGTYMVLDTSLAAGETAGRAEGGDAAPAEGAR